ncbi:MAG TPA: hypothetical protein VF668_03105 [Pyrinomonadaceae bacterium]|jgi:hypothetical protein
MPQKIMVVDGEPADARRLEKLFGRRALFGLTRARETTTGMVFERFDSVAA